MPSLPNVSLQSRRPLLLALTVVLLLRSRLINGPKEALLKLRSATYRRKLSPEEFSQALQQVYVNEADGSKTILVPHRNSISKVRQWSSSHSVARSPLSELVILFSETLRSGGRVG